MFLNKLWSSLRQSSPFGKRARRARRREFLAGAKRERTLRLERLEDRALLAAVITATLTDNIPTGTGVNPGSNISCTAVISNTAAPAGGGANDATSLQVALPLDSRATLTSSGGRPIPAESPRSRWQTVIFLPRD